MSSIFSRKVHGLRLLYSRTHVFQYIEIYAGCFHGAPVQRPPSLFLPYRAASAGGFREFVSRMAEIVEFLGFFYGFSRSRDVKHVSRCEHG